MSQTQLTKEERLELAVLQAALDCAMTAKLEWLDRKMVEHSNLKVGDDIYDLSTGLCIGKVTRIYRYWREQRRFDLDDTIDCDYQFGVPGGYTDNTSSQPGRRLGTKEEAVRLAASRMEGLK